MIMTAFRGFLTRLSQGTLGAAAMAAALLILSGPLSAQVQVTTQHNDNFRTGQNLSETILTPAVVSSSQFGKIFSVVVDGKVYGQPLYMPNVTIPGKGVHNVVYIVTEHDSVYAWDADSNTGQNSAPLWAVSFISPAHGITTVSSSDINCSSVGPEVGITATPVIDPSNNTMYILAQTKENGNFVHRLHALDITSGAEKFGGPVVIQASYPGTGDGSQGGMINFDPLNHLARSGLLLSNGNIFIAWASNCDDDPYHGWLMAYDESNLHQTAVWMASPNGRRGGIWTSGAGLSADAAGNVYIPIGNGTFDTSGQVSDFGDSIVKLTLNGNQLTATDYFTPYNQANLDNADADVGSGGALMLPDQSGSHVHELIEAGKEGSIYVIDRDNMGHYNPNDNSQIVQNITNQISGIFGIPAYWNNNVYFGSGGFHLQAFSLTDGLLSSTPTSQSPTNLGYPGTTPSVSANGNSDGIVWAIQSANRLNNGYEVLHAYDATDLNVELYSSLENPQRDNPGPVVHFTVPTIANGKVYVGSNQLLSVYGMLSQEPPASAPTFTPSPGDYTSTQSLVLADSTPSATIYYTTDGSTPTTSSPVYTAPIIVSQTTTIKAIATAPGYLQSTVASGVITILSGGGGAINFGNGFAPALSLVGNAQLNGTRLRLTDGHQSEAGAMWYTTPVNVQSFSQDFSIQLTNANGDGMAFVIQNVGSVSLGPGGAGLGYGATSPGGPAGIPTSLAVKFDLYSNYGEGPNSTGMYVDGESPTVPAVDMRGSGIDLHSGHVLNVHMDYDGAILSLRITDTVTGHMFSYSWPIDIPSTVGGSTAYIGFTGGSGGGTAIQEVLNWTFTPSGPSYPNGFSSDGLSLSGGATRSGSHLRLTDGSPGRIASAWYGTPVNVQAFAQDFNFQITNPQGDGMTFVIQRAGTNVVGPGGGGLGYGASSPNGTPGIPNSVAVKFDIYDNFGEGRNSTGLYTQGASPTIPAIDMTDSGVYLRNGDMFNVHMTYDGSTLSMVLTDTVTQQSFSNSWPIDIPATVGGTTAYVGFTAASGGAGSIQEVLNWTFVSPAAISYGNGFTSTGLNFKGNAKLNGSRLQLTDGSPSERASAWYKSRVNVQSFTQDFDLQLSNPHGDGMTFVIQNAGSGVLGPGGAGLGYGATSPTGAPGIGHSLAVKFDIYSNFGEGKDSTGLYTNGASPTIPAVDMTGSGIDLRRGNVLHVHMTYDGTTLTMQITDTVTMQSFQASWTIDIPATVGGSTAYLGFTGSSGSSTAIQEVLNWTYVP